MNLVLGTLITNYFHSVMRTSPNGGRNRATEATSRFEKLNMLRTRRTSGRATKKEAAGSAGQTGKGDRWADFNLLRTGRSDPVLIVF